jgi:hypothetical protein
MATAAKTQSKGFVKTRKTANTEYNEPKRLSKAGQWLRKHPNGLEGVVINDLRILDGLSIYDF